MKRLLTRIPGWVWLLALVAGAFLVQEWRVQGALRARDAAREAQFGAALQAIEAQREEQTRGVRVLNAERERLRADLESHRRRVAALEQRTGEAAATVERVGREAERLVTGGSLDEVVAAWRALGWTLIPAPKPRP